MSAKQKPAHKAQTSKAQIGKFLSSLSDDLEVGAAKIEDWATLLFASPTCTTILQSTGKVNLPGMLSLLFTQFGQLNVVHAKLILCFFISLTTCPKEINVDNMPSETFLKKMYACFNANTTEDQEEIDILATALIESCIKAWGKEKVSMLSQVVMYLQFTKRRNGTVTLYGGLLTYDFTVDGADQLVRKYVEVLDSVSDALVHKTPGFDDTFLQFSIFHRDLGRMVLVDDKLKPSLEDKLNIVRARCSIEVTIVTQKKGVVRKRTSQCLSRARQNLTYHTGANAFMELSTES